MARLFTENEAPEQRPAPAILDTSETPQRATEAVPLTSPGRNPDLATATIQQKNGVDVAAIAPASPPSFNDRVAEFFTGNWKYIVGALMAGGYLVLPASTARVDAVDAKISTVIVQIADHDKRLDRIEDTTIRIEQKIDRIAVPALAAAPAPPKVEPTVVTRPAHKGATKNGRKKNFLGF